MAKHRSWPQVLLGTQEHPGTGPYEVLIAKGSTCAGGRGMGGGDKLGRHYGLQGRLVRWLDDYFGVSAAGSSVITEVRGGVIAWMAMSYIMVVNPVILCKAWAPNRGDGAPLEPQAVMTATALSAALSSLICGLAGRAPLALMPGMGLNAYFSFGLCHAFGVTWQEAMSCCFVSGALLAAFAALGICDVVVAKVLSDHLKKAITVAIGVFQALIGFQVMGVVVGSQDTLVTLGDLSWPNDQLYLALTGLALISAMLASNRIHGSILIGIWAMAVMSWVVGLQEPPRGFAEFPNLSAVLSISFGAWSPGGNLSAMIIGTLVLLFVALFDLAGVQFGLMGMAGRLQDGQVPRSRSIFCASGLGTMAGSLLGTSPVIVASESSAGIAEGAKTGLMAVVVAVLFLLSAFISPVLVAVPHVATAVPLVLIGSFMMAPCRGIDWDNLREAIPSFLTITVVPFTYSIHTGILAGIAIDLFLGACIPAAVRPAPEAVADAKAGAAAGGKPEPAACEPRKLSLDTTIAACGTDGYSKQALARLLFEQVKSSLAAPAVPRDSGSGFGQANSDADLGAALRRYLGEP